MKKIQYILLSLVALAGCDKFLDKMPDNRTEIDSQEKIQALLVSAYPPTDYMLVTEFMSDNVDDYGTNNPYTDRFIDQVFAWDDVTESDNEDPESVWESSYHAIACANEAIQAIDSLTSQNGTLDLSAERAEALLCRAYNHFILVNVFCIAYNPETSGSDLGIPYMEKPETMLNPDYDRRNVAEVYAKIEKDLEMALPYVSDRYYTVPKYHFNKQAAYAFAARFYLYYGQYDKAIQYATDCLGPSPQNFIRDYADLQANYSTIAEARLAYNSTDQKANFLLITGYSNIGLFWGNYSGAYKHFGFTNVIAENESFFAPTPWNSEKQTAASFVWRPRQYNSSSLHYPLFWKIDYEFEYTDPVAGIGYRHTVYPCFTADQTLLDRAEAYILLKRYDEALADLNLWVNNLYVATVNLTTDMIDTFYNGLEYYEWDKPTQKKKLEPRKPIVIQDKLQENMIHFLLTCRRTETMGQGMRWFDIKRYGITVYRREVDSNGDLAKITDTLGPDDLRRAVQIPQKSRDAGFEGNKR